MSHQCEADQMFGSCSYASFEHVPPSVKILINWLCHNRSEVTCYTVKLTLPWMPIYVQIAKRKKSQIKESAKVVAPCHNDSSLP